MSLTILLADDTAPEPSVWRTVISGNSELIMLTSGTSNLGKVSIEVKSGAGVNDATPIGSLQMQVGQESVNAEQAKRITGPVVYRVRRIGLSPAGVSVEA